MRAESSDELLSAALSSLSVSSSLSSSAPLSTASSTLLSPLEGLVDEWQSLRLLEERGEEEGGGWVVSREHCARVLCELVDELVVVCVMEAKLVAPLSARDWAESERLISQLPPSATVASAFNLDIQASHLRCLARLQWLNDEVINFYLQLLQQRQDTRTYTPLIALTAHAHSHSSHSQADIQPQTGLTSTLCSLVSVRCRILLCPLPV